jgi:hypothetical protein
MGELPPGEIAVLHALIAGCKDKIRESKMAQFASLQEKYLVCRFYQNFISNCIGKNLKLQLLSGVSLPIRCTYLYAR